MKALWTILFVLVASRVDATPVTMFYVGSVETTFDTRFVPLGSPATIRLTSDGINLNLTAPNRPANGGAYNFTAVVSFLDRDFTARGVFEVNWDGLVNYPTPGIVRELLWGIDGPPLFGTAQTFPPQTSWMPHTLCPWPSCASVAGYTDPSSPDFPNLFTLGFDITFSGGCAVMGCSNGGTVRVFGVDPPFAELERVASVPVPEPSTFALVSLGVMFLRRKP